ncbi:MAG: BamA/TamA family outer membrane protein, partial [bacterium]
RYSWGFGLRFRTPVGPVRLDWARKFKILPVRAGRGSENKSMWHLSLGHVF